MDPAGITVLQINTETLFVELSRIFATRPPAQPIMPFVEASKPCRKVQQSEHWPKHKVGWDLHIAQVSLIALKTLFLLPRTKSRAIFCCDDMSHLSN